VDLFDSQEVKRVKREISACVGANGWTAVIGPTGVGKTTAVWAALAGMPEVKLIQPLQVYKEQMTVNAIIEAAIRDHGEEHEPMPSSREARMRRFRRVVGELAQPGRVLLVLEEAHIVPHHVLSACKRLREIEWAGVRPILGVLLVGQPALAAKLRRMREVGLRCRQVSLTGLASAEVKPYLSFHGIAVSDAVAAEMGRATREPLALLRMAEEIAGYTAARGGTRIAVEDVRKAGVLSLQERVRRLGVSGAELARLAGMSKSAVNQILNGKYPGSAKQTQKLQSAAETLDRDRAAG
jgi:DNA transposition AAA+ family ATPase